MERLPARRFESSTVFCGGSTTVFFLIPFYLRPLKRASVGVCAVMRSLAAAVLKWLKELLRYEAIPSATMTNPLPL